MLMRIADKIKFHINKREIFVPVLSVIMVACILAGCGRSQEHVSYTADSLPVAGNEKKVETVTEEAPAETPEEASVETPDHEYGVFLGCTDSDLYERAKDYKVVICDGQDISEENVLKLSQNSSAVYAYLDVGSLETYRDYYERFKDLALDEYDNWPDEYWIDVSDESWQDFLVSELAPEFKNKGFKGLFLDNADVYYMYQREDIYEGLVSVLEGLHTLDMDIIVNGGDVFVTRLIGEGKASLIGGINQESVYSMIKDYELDEFGVQETEDTEYYEEYLDAVKNSGCRAYVLEYIHEDDNELRDYAKQKCEEKGYTLYISDSLSLN